MGALNLFEKAAGETPISKFIPYSHHITESIISTRNAEYLSVFKIGGRAHECVSRDDLLMWSNSLQAMLQGLVQGSGNFSFWTHTVRRRVVEYPDTKFDNSFCDTLNAKYRASFAKNSFMLNELYLTILFKPVGDSVLSFFSKYERESIEVRRARQASYISAMEEANKTILHGLKRYDVNLLGCYEHGDQIYSAALEFLAFLVNGEHNRIPVSRNRFGDYIAMNRVLFSLWGDVGEVRLIDKTRRFGMLEIKEYPSTPFPGQFNALLAGDYEFVLTQSFSTTTRSAAIEFINGQLKEMNDADDAGASEYRQLEEALDQVKAGEVIFGEHHGTLLVYGDSIQEVNESLSKAKNCFTEAATIPAKIDLGLEAAFWAQLPGNWRYRPRPAMVNSYNFLYFSPFHNFMSGKPIGNPWGEAVTVLKTQSGTPLYFNFHSSKEDEDALDKKLSGNTIILGKTGSGKTVLLGFLLTQAQKFNPTIVAFDKDRGLEVAIRAMEGKYLPLKNGEPSGFNPLQLEPTPANLLFLRAFIKQLITRDEQGVSLSDEREIGQALDTVMLRIDKPNRRLSTLLQSLPNPIELNGEFSVHARLQKWCEGGELGWLFDNPSDALNLESHKCYGFDITDFLENAETRSATMMYLIYRTEAMLDGRRFIYVFDEFWKALPDPYFQDLVKNKLKTIRKQNGLCLFATQEPGDALSSPIAKTIIQQCATYVFLANPGADSTDYQEGFKLTDTEFNAVSRIPEGSNQFLIKQGSNTALAELKLHEFQDELLVLSGTPENAALVESLTKEVGDNPQIWLPLFLESVKARRAKP